MLPPLQLLGFSKYRNLLGFVYEFTGAGELSVANQGLKDARVMLTG
jgi:hypothetical protein